MTKLPAGEMNFLDHLEELRRVIIDSIVAALLGLGVSWFFSGRLVELLIASTIPPGTPVVFLGPGEAFGVRIQVALGTGILLALPFILYRIWQFVVPGLLREERSFVLPIVIGGSCLFYLGGAFGLLILIPLVTKILLAFGTPSLKPTIAIGQLLGFVVRLVLACGLLFQLPIVTLFLTWFGVVTPERLWRVWRYAVVIIFVVAAAVTPGDGPSQLVLAIPVTVLYFASVGLAYLVRTRRGRRSAAGEAPTSALPRGSLPEDEPPG
jgi:sec-independent protein translocase protein TatC